MNNENQNQQPATDFIRRKIENLYSVEPSAQSEVEEVKQVQPESKHQFFMKNLVNSGKDIATIQTEWHNYYIGLSEADKHQVWNEFYAVNKNLKKPEAGINSFEMHMAHQKNQIIGINQYQHHNNEPKSVLKAVHSKISANGKLKLKHHLKSLLFGLGIGAIAVFIFMFGFFNEILITPFIQPSRNVSAVPVILDSSSTIATSTPEVIIPKINVQIPVNYTNTSTNENTIENFLEDGVVHYPSTVMPGQLGNAAFFGHSSNNIFNPGKYKFAFVLLHTLVPGDTFYLTYNHTLYVYTVISRNIVSPNDVSVLGPVSGQSATATLITCDPPGTSINRLVVVGQQISPSISNDTAAPITINPTQGTTQLPGNGPTLWDRFIKSNSGKITIIVIVLAGTVIVFRKINKRRQ